MQLAAKLFHPSTIALIAANLLPLVGIWLWNWDAFLLLALYWMETAVIGFWTILAVAIAPLVAVGPSAGQTSRWFLVPFFMVHGGIFMSVHFIFLWSVFSGAWASRAHDVHEFIDRIVIETGLWIPLAALFVSRGVSFFFLMFGRVLLPAWLMAEPRGKSASEHPLSEGSLIGGFYSRVVLMHVTILFGAAIAAVIGNAGPLILMVALKIAIDVTLHLKNDFATKPVVMTTA